MIIRRKEFNKRILSQITRGVNVVVPLKGITAEEIQALRELGFSVKLNQSTKEVTLKLRE